MKKVFYLLTICLSISVFYSCSKDDDGGGSGNGGKNYNGHGYVDLGLSVKWATCNIGASSPEDYGDYYAWGEVGTKSYYDWSTYKWCNGSYTTMTKYCTSSSYGKVDNKMVLDLEDDVAHVKWGGSWRMPTKVEQDELRTNCTWTWTTQNGVNGYKVTGPNGNSIFLPAAGCCYESDLDYVGSYGYYRSSSLNSSISSYAYFLKFKSSNVSSGSDRCSGFSVRAVYDDGGSGNNSSGGNSTDLIVTGSYTDLTSNGVTLKGWVSSAYTSVAEVGIVYSSTNKTPVRGTDLYVVAHDFENGNFSISVSGLSAETTYYYRAYYYVNGNCNYASVKSFKTEKRSTGTKAYVDLGLPSGLLWATCNVGASSPEEYGDYYAWGETDTKSNYSWNTYFDTTNSGNTFTKYNHNGGKTTLELSDDVAHVKWGGSWRMPTYAEQTELRTKCTWTWTTQNGKNGYKVTGTNGNSIFLPAAGYRYVTSLNGAGSYGRYWSSSLYSSDSDDAYDLGFGSGYVGWYSIYRCDGFSVRAVSE